MILLIAPVLTLLSAIAAISASAAELSLEQCLDSALVANKNIRAKALGIEKAARMKGTAFDPENTSVVLKQETTGGGGPENGVMFSQDFEFPTVYIARHKTLKAQEDLQKSYYSVAVSDLVAEISSEYQNALYLNHLLDLNGGIETSYREFLQIARARFAAGECGRLEVINAERSLEDCLLERDRLSTDLSASLGKLTYLAGCAEPVSLPRDARLELFGPEAATSEFDYHLTPRGNASGSAVRIAETEINLERQKLFPSLNIGVTLQALIKSFNPYQIDREPFKPGNFMGFEAGISVPVFFWAQTSRLKSAKSELAAVRLEQEYAAMEAENEYTALRDKLMTLKRNIDILEEKSLPRADEISRIADVSYKFGEIDYLEYVSNLENAYAIRKDYAAAVNDYNQTAVMINHLTGTR